MTEPRQVEICKTATIVKISERLKALGEQRGTQIRAYRVVIFIGELIESSNLQFSTCIFALENPENFVSLDRV